MAKSDARKKAIKALKSEMRKDGMSPMGEKLKDKMAVKVVADDEEGLMEGLEEAEDVLEGGMPDMLKEAFKNRSKKSKKKEDK